MSLYEDAVATAVKLPLAERERLAQALGLKLAPRATLQMAAPMARPMPKLGARPNAVTPCWMSVRLMPNPAPTRFAACGLALI